MMHVSKPSVKKAIKNFWQLDWLNVQKMQRALEIMAYM